MKNKEITFNIKAIRIFIIFNFLGILVTAIGSVGSLRKRTEYLEHTVHNQGIQAKELLQRINSGDENGIVYIHSHKHYEDGKVYINKTECKDRCPKMSREEYMDKLMEIYF